MPIFIAVGQPEGSVGPGHPFTLISDFVGPLPSGTSFDVRVQVDADDESTLVVRTLLPTNSTIVGGRMWVSTPVSQWLGGLQLPAEGSTVHVLATLHTPTAVIDSGATTAIMRYTTGLGNQITLQPTSSGGGLTVDQAAQLAAAAAQTARAFPLPAGGSSLVDVAQLLVHPPVELLRAVDSGDLLTGRGSITHPGILGPVNAFGMLLSFFTVPAGFGLRDGAVQEYQHRILQLATTHLTSNGDLEYVSEVADLTQDGYLWMWRNFAPNRILYDVSPGCVVQVRWMMLIFP